MQKYIQLIVVGILVSSALHAQDTPRQQLQTVAANYEKWLNRDFQVNVKSKDLNKVIEKTINARAGKMAAQFGIQAPKINLDSFQFNIKDQETHVKAKLAQGTLMKSQMEAEANKALTNSPFGKTLESLAFGFLRQGVDVLKNESLALDVRKNDEQQMTVILTGIQDKIMNQSIDNVALNINKKTNLLNIMRTNLEGGGYIMSKFKYTGAKTLEGSTVPVIQAMQITRKGLPEDPETVTLPPQFVIRYSAYKLGE